MFSKKVFFVLLLLGLAFLTGCSGDKKEMPKDQGKAEQTVPAKEVPAGFRVTIVGSGNPQLTPLRANPCTIVQYRDKIFVVDIGSGAVSNMMKFGFEVGKITNLLFTHHHTDHNADFWGFAIGGWGYPGGRRVFNIVGPTGTQELYDLMIHYNKKDLAYRTTIVGFPPEGILKNVNIREITGETDSFEMDGVKISPLKVPHTIITYAYKFEAGGKTVVISGDTKYKEAFALFTKDADLLVQDGQLSNDLRDLPPKAQKAITANLAKSHIKNEEIARVLGDAQPKTVILSHLSGKMDLESNKELYKKAGYTGEVLQAYDGLVVEL